MKRSHLIIMYFIVYVVVVLAVMQRLIVFHNAKNEILKIDRAIEVAGDKTASVLKNHVYEDNPRELMESTFIYTYAVQMDATEYYDILEDNNLIKDIYVGINGEIIKDYSRLMEVHDSDSLAIYIILNDFSIRSFGRTFVISREFYKEIER